MLRLILFLCLLAPLAASAEDDLPLPPPLASPLPMQTPLTVAGALSRATSANSDLQVTLGQAREAWYAYQKAGSPASAQLAAGTLQGNGQAVLNSSYSGLSHDFFLQLTQPFGPLGTLSTAQQVAAHGYRQALERYSAAQVSLNRKVKDAFYTLLAAQETLRVAQKTREWADEIFRVAEIRHKSGASPRLDLINARAERNQAQLKVVRAEGQVGVQLARLNELLGLAPDQPYELAGSLEAPPLTEHYPDLLRLAQAHPRLRAAQAELGSARAQLKLAQQQGNPTPGLFAVYDITRPGYVVGAQISIPIDWGQIRNEVSAQTERVAQTESSYESELRSLTADLRASYMDYEAAYRNSDVYLADILTPLEEAARITGFGYTQGALPYTQLLQAQARLEEARLDYIEVLLSVHLAFDALEAAVGHLEPVSVLPPENRQTP